MEEIALSRLRTYHLLEKLKINYKAKQNPNEIPDNSIILLSGGGNLTRYYSDLADALQNLKLRSKQIVILPHTISGHEEQLKSLDERVTIFAREKKTHDYLCSLELRARILLDHDMAFHIDTEKLDPYGVFHIVQDLLINCFLKLSGRCLPENIPSGTIAKRALFDMMRIYARGKKSGLFYRTDAESTTKITPKNSVDLSESFHFGVGCKEICRKATSGIFRVIANCPEIKTDRLHIGIAAALIGKETELYPNSYHKIKSVYDFSLKERFDCVVMKK